MRNNKIFSLIFVTLALCILVVVCVLLAWSKSENKLHWEILNLDFDTVYDAYENINRVLNLLLLILLLLFIYIQRKAFKWIGITLVLISIFLLEKVDLSPF